MVAQTQKPLEQQLLRVVCAPPSKPISSSSTTARMERGDWFPGVTDGEPQQITFVAMSTVDDLSYSPSENQKHRDIAQIAATGRRSWKTLRGKPEAVWPPALEGALIEGLEEYQKIEARPTTSKNGVRYPMRNRFLSDFIFEKTGKMRTAKQVGSRLQQLRDTCKNETLFTLLGRGTSQEAELKTEMPRSPSRSQSRELTDSPSPTEEQSKVVVYMQIEFPSHRMEAVYQVPRIQFTPNDMNTPYALHLLPVPQQHSSSSRSIPSSIGAPSALSFFSNLVEIVSPWPLSLEANWSIYKDSTLVARETSTMRVRSSSSGQTYACELVPAFWERLCNQQDPNHITIVQVLTSSPITLYEVNSLSNAMSPLPSSTQKEVSIVYHFNLPDYQKTKYRLVNPTDLRHIPTNPSPSHNMREHGGSHSQGYQDQSMTGGSSGYWPSGTHDSYTYQGTGQNRGSHSGSPGDIQTASSATGNNQYSLHAREHYHNTPEYMEERSDIGTLLYGQPRSMNWNYNASTNLTAPSFNRPYTMDGTCY